MRYRYIVGHERQHIAARQGWLVEVVGLVFYGLGFFVGLKPRPTMCVYQQEKTSNAFMLKGIEVGLGTATLASVSTFQLSLWSLSSF